MTIFQQSCVDNRVLVLVGYFCFQWPWCNKLTWKWRPWKRALAWELPCSVASPSHCANYYFSQLFPTPFQWLLLSLVQTGLESHNGTREDLFAQELNVVLKCLGATKVSGI